MDLPSKAKASGPANLRNFTEEGGEKAYCAVTGSDRVARAMTDLLTQRVPTHRSLFLVEER